MATNELDLKSNSSTNLNTAQQSKFSAPDVKKLPNDNDYEYKREHKRNGVPETIELNEDGLPAHWTLTRKLGLAGGIGAAVGAGLTVAGAATLTTAYTTGVIVKDVFVATGTAVGAGVGTVLWPIGLVIIGATGLTVGGIVVGRNVHGRRTWRTLKRALDNKGQNKKAPAYLFCNAAKHAWEDMHYEKKELIDLIKEAKSLKEDIDDLSKDFDDVYRNDVGFPRSLWTTKEKRLKELTQKLDEKLKLVRLLRLKIFEKFPNLKLKKNNSNEKPVGVLSEDADINAILKALQQKQFYTDYVEKHLYLNSIGAYEVRDNVTGEIFQFFPTALTDKKGLKLAELRLDQNNTPYYKIFDPPIAPAGSGVPNDWKAYNSFIKRKRKGKDPYQQPDLPVATQPMTTPVPTQPVVSVPQVVPVTTPVVTTPVVPVPQPVTTTTPVVPVPQPVTTTTPVVPPVTEVVQPVVPVTTPVQQPQVVQPQYPPVQQPVPVLETVRLGSNVNYQVVARSPLQQSGIRQDDSSVIGYRSHTYTDQFGAAAMFSNIRPANQAVTVVKKDEIVHGIVPVDIPMYKCEIPNDTASYREHARTNPGKGKILRMYKPNAGQPYRTSFQQVNPANQVYPNSYSNGVR